TADTDTVCQACPNRSYSDVSSAVQNCTLHRSCSAAGLQLLLRGSSWHDSICSACEQRAARNGTDYLKEILPAFFVHQNMAMKRLRRLAHKLLSEGGSKANTSGLHRTDLYAQINAWLSSAGPENIRKLLDTLKEIGANDAPKKLERKLQHINSQLSKPCAGTREEVVGK
ncbi:hypothetical protein LDENG_00099690, partial [Lucifuga dentata]